MGTLSYLAESQLERRGRQIHSELAKLRRRRLDLLAANGYPMRNPDLDPLVDQLRIFRASYDFQIRAFEADGGIAAIEMSVLARAREILSDVADLIDLLVWFGAKAHVEPDIVDRPATPRTL